MKSRYSLVLLLLSNTILPYTCLPLDHPQAYRLTGTTSFPVFAHKCSRCGTIWRTLQPAQACTVVCNQLHTYLVNKRAILESPLSEDEQVKQLTPWENTRITLTRIKQELHSKYKHWKPYYHNNPERPHD